MRRGYLKNTITYTIIVLSQIIFKQISKVLCNSMMSGNQILEKSASNINSHIIFFQFINKKIILAMGKSCFGCFFSSERDFLNSPAITGFEVRF